MTVETAAPPDRQTSSGAVLWLAASAALAAATSLYVPIVIGLVRQWYEDANAAYGAVVAIAAIVAVRQRWRRLRGIIAHGSWWGAVALGAAAMLYVAGTLAADVFLLRVSLLALGAATLWFACGAACVRALATPITLLLVAIPLPSALVTGLTMPLQLAASSCAASLLQLMGISVLRDGNVLTLNYITLEVAEACSGMRSIVTLLALVAVYGAICGAPLRRLALLAVATVPVAIAGNGLRVACTAVLASQMGEAAVRGVVHDATGWVAFVVMAAALAGIHALGSRSTGTREAAA